MNAAASSDTLARIALVGPMGIGKTTAVRALCGNHMVDTDVPNLDRASHAKEFTTVGAEFGEIDLGDGSRVQVCGCPGQERFAFLRQWVLSVSIGVFIMVDVNEPQAAAECARLLAEAGQAADPAPMCIVLSTRAAPPERLQAFCSQLESLSGSVMPVLEVDVRERKHMLEALEVLVALLNLETDPNLV
jgi:signal recognition particle receptor subunit beta